MMTAQQQFGLVRPVRSRRHDNPYNRSGHAAASHTGGAGQHRLAGGGSMERSCVVVFPGRRLQEARVHAASFPWHRPEAEEAYRTLPRFQGPCPQAPPHAQPRCCRSTTGGSGVPWESELGSLPRDFVLDEAECGAIHNGATELRNGDIHHEHPDLHPDRAHRHPADRWPVPDPAPGRGRRRGGSPSRRRPHRGLVASIVEHPGQAQHTDLDVCPSPAPRAGQPGGPRPGPTPTPSSRPRPPWRQAPRTKALPAR